MAINLEALTRTHTLSDLRDTAAALDLAAAEQTVYASQLPERCAHLPCAYSRRRAVRLAAAGWRRKRQKTGPPRSVRGFAASRSAPAATDQC